jgi:hypothetical protein
VDDDDSDDSNFNGRHPGLDDGDGYRLHGPRLVRYAGANDNAPRLGGRRGTTFMSRHSVVIGSFVCPLGYCGSGVLGSCPRSRPTVTLRTPPDPETPAVEAVTGRTATSDAGRELNRAFTQLIKQLVPDALSVDVLAKQMGVPDSLVNDAHGRMPSTGCDDVSIVNHCTINFESRGLLGSILGPDLSLLESFALFVWTYQQNQQPSSSVFFSQQTSEQCFQHNKPAKRLLNSSASKTYRPKKKFRTNV